MYIHTYLICVNRQLKQETRRNKYGKSSDQHITWMKARTDTQTKPVILSVCVY